MTEPPQAQPEEVPLPFPAHSGDPSGELPPPELPMPAPMPGVTNAGPVRQESDVVLASAIVGVRPSLASFAQPAMSAQPASGQPADAHERGDLSGVRLPAESWNAIPESCLERMMEFGRVESEYQRTFGRPFPRVTQDAGQRLSLEQILELALLNSREYQTEKEALYRTALNLSLERFDYVLKFSPRGTSVNSTWSHNRAGGQTVNTLSVAPGTQVDKVLATGGTLVARFANSVLLTFNGPNGFSADVSSQALLNLSQSVFQRDVVFEQLTQSERNVVYAARDYARFRKSFFLTQSASYYALLRNYRQIEIESQNYFSLVRALSQAQAELSAGLRSRIQVEQIEQSMLAGQSRLISICVNFERALDRLKLQMGLPPETRLNLSLDELESLTLRDEMAVTGELIRRTSDRLDEARRREPIQRTELINGAVVLAGRLLEWNDLGRRLGDPMEDRAALDHLLAELAVDQGRLVNAADREALNREETSGQSTAIRIFQRTVDVAESEIELLGRELNLARRVGAPADPIDSAQAELQQLRDQVFALREGLANALTQARLDQVAGLLAEARALLARADALAGRTAEHLGAARPAEDPAGTQARTLAQIAILFETSARWVGEGRVGLVPVTVEVDDAMLTALSLRLDLMNQRGFLADDRRAVKLAADDLKSVLNLNVSHTLNTVRNRPFGFTFDESRTQAQAALDLPINRRAQRNAYRQTLINYQVGLRNLMQLEDSIKLAVRDDLRDLSLDRTQYQISVASAALANERVTSTRLELALGFAGVAARDFLEAQDAYRQALGAVADNHIGYILDRTQFFLDLELLQVNEMGFWPELRNDQFQPEVWTTLPPEAGFPYGDLPPGVLYSREVRGLHRPPGVAGHMR
jgi:outer membrane protein TolC